MKFAVGVLLLLTLVIAGCTQPSQPAPTAVATPAPTATVQLPTATPTPTPAAMEPLKLDYEFKQSSTQLYLTLWLTEERICSGRKALLGVYKASPDKNAQDERAMWAKATVYEDDGTMATSASGSKSGLAFDNAKPTATDFDFFLTLNNMFAHAGKNFNTDPVWNSTVPTVLRNVLVGTSLINVSVIKAGESSVNDIPCTKFTLMGEGNGPQEMDLCVARPASGLPLPFMVSFSIGTDFNIKMTSSSKAKPQAVYYPQCMDFVKCSLPAQVTQGEQDACTARGGTIDPVRDDRNCVASYACRTDRERALDDIQSSQSSPSCPAPGEALVSKAIECRKGPGHDWVRDSKGCITDVTCGQMAPQQ